MTEPRIAGRYELLEKIADGGMGAVWRGFDAVLDRPVAVKLVRGQMIGSPAQGQEFVKRFQREARVTARIQHAGVPQVYDAVLSGGHDELYLVMELVDGKPLTAYRMPLPIGWAAAIAAQVATVLSYAHDVPVVHRDLKPGNIMVARDGTVKVLDFGIAAILRTDVTKLTDTGHVIGTREYMAPEQVVGGGVTPLTDIYALGCVLHELLSGAPVFRADNAFLLLQRHVNDAPVPLRQLRPEVPRPLADLVLHMLRKEPEQRPADVQEIHERLLPFLPAAGQQPLPGADAPPGVPDPTEVFRRPYGPRPRGGPGHRPADGVPPDLAGPLPGQDDVRDRIQQVHQHYDALMAEERFAQAAEVVGEMTGPAARALGADNAAVLGLRMRRAVSWLLSGDFRAALPEFDALADAYARTAGSSDRKALDCRAQAARCRAELGQATEALATLRGVLAVVRSVDGDLSEDAVELRRDIGMLLLAQGELREALDLLAALHADLLLVYGPADEMSAEIAETIALVRAGLGRPAAG
ncbi:Serine_threonine-protein kinase PknD [Streptomyces sp. enrichment culture]|uniref:serine/threonine-protein kinase n=1 Tax=Streptomyces sp. enrichment culture TaxID=1795815 RepID=UPI003F54D4D6